MTARELFDDLRLRDVRLTCDGDDLRVDAPIGVLNPDLRDQLRRCKAELLRAVRDANACTGDAEQYDVPDGWIRDHWIDRLDYLASICIHAGRAAELRAWADGLRRQSGKNTGLADE